MKEIEIERMLFEAKLPEYAITEIFRNRLRECQNQKELKSLICERRELIRQAIEDTETIRREMI